MISKETRKKAREKAEALVGQMTLEEKAAQLKYGAPALKRLGIPAYNWWNEGLHGVAKPVRRRYFRRRSEWQRRLIQSC